MIRLYILCSLLLLMASSCFKDLDRNNPCDINNPNAVVSGLPVPNFSYQRTGNVVKFINNSVNATEFVWNFGDGETETATNPIHVYPIAEEANYTVILTAKNACNTNSVEKSLIISLNCPQEPFANFSYSLTGKTITFTNLSVNAQTFQWTFGDDATNNTANPTHTYANFGSYTITLWAYGANFCTAIYKTTITVEDCNPQPLAGFSFATNANNYTVTFTNTSQNATLYYWNFGDGNYSTQPNPVHTYAQPGVYTVVLGATNTCGTVVSLQELSLLFITDDRDGAIYPIAKIGNQYWMADNLNYGVTKESYPFSGVSPTCSGDGFPSNQTNNSNAEKYCYQNNPDNCNAYGGLYQWQEAMNYNPANTQGICPAGWHIPSAEEWNELETYLGAQAGNQLKDVGNSGFNAKMSGYRNYSGGFSFLGNYTGFWSSAETDNCRAVVRSLQSTNAMLLNTPEEKNNGYCIRCLKD
ncbi:MAG TPA: FISUMP domain-containing protein [Chitinophagales bacterium]|nr:FISUMP domain-containing protein [Chitinophagales bacterium]HRK29248.1 FISUMP domain-containing protein [Chitinophagales bacterium]